MSLNSDLTAFYASVHASFDTAQIVDSLATVLFTVQARLIHDVDAAAIAEIDLTQNDYIIAISSGDGTYIPVEGHRIVLDGHTYLIGARVSFSNEHEHRVVGNRIHG